MTENVIDLAQKRNAKKKKNDDPGKTEILKELAEALHPAPISQRIGPLRTWPHGSDFRIFERSDGSREWVRVHGDRVLSRVREEDVVASYASAIGVEYRDLSLKDVIEIVRTAFAVAAHLHSRSVEPFIVRDVRTVCFLSDDCWTWRRLDFDPDATCDQGLWGSFLERTSNSDALLAWIGSLFDDASNREQYVWMVGEGASGKSTVVDVLLELFETAGHATTDDATDTPFFTAELVGKRLVHIDEAKTTTVNSGRWKSLTGSNWHRIEEKYQPARKEQLACKFVCTSNDYPEIRAAKENFRRIILCEVDAPTDRLLTRQSAREGYRMGLPWLLALALEKWVPWAQEAKIDADLSVVEEYAHAADDEMAATFSKHFRQEPGAWVASTTIYSLLEADGLKRWEIRKLIRAWVQRKILVPKRTTTGRGYFGARLVTDSDHLSF